MIQGQLLPDHRSKQKLLMIMEKSQKEREGLEVLLTYLRGSNIGKAGMEGIKNTKKDLDGSKNGARVLLFVS